MLAHVLMGSLCLCLFFFKQTTVHHLVLRDCILDVFPFVLLLLLPLLPHLLVILLLHLLILPNAPNLLPLLLDQRRAGLECISPRSPYS